MTRIVFFLSLLLLGTHGFAQDFTFRPDRFTQRITSSEIKRLPHVMDYTDEAKFYDLWDNPALLGTEYKYKSLENIVRIGVNHDTGVVVPAYKYRVLFEVSYYDVVANRMKWEDLTLDFSYNPDSLQQYNDLAVFRRTGYFTFWVDIISVSNMASGTPVSVPASDLAPNFYIESEIASQRYDLKPQQIAANCSTLYANRELNVYWQLFDASSTAPCPLTSYSSTQFKPVSYELEWCYIDDYHLDLASGTPSYRFAGGGDINYDFRKNSTRVQVTQGTTFKIPLIYEHGAIIYRLRTVRPDPVQYKDLVYGNWTLPDYGTINASSSCFPANGYLITDPHQHDSLNWQYTVNFAEDGKYKHVINYFDGSLKDRQTQTRINSDASYIVAVDKAYDYEGRPAIISLPSPVSGQSALAYRPDILLNSRTGNPYRAQDFDSKACSRPDSIAPLSATAKAYQYYSPLNPDQSGMQRFVPDAKGYPLVQTVYSPDNTNKVLWQGGAGLEQQLWRGHAIRYEYSRATQSEMDRYLGTEAGIHQYYPKQVVTDPNGQSSYSILDPAGKVVISGLQGPAPDAGTKPIEPLPNFVAGALKCEDLLSGYRQVKSDNSISAQLPVYNDDIADASFQYSVKTFPYNTGCSGQYLSVAGLYDVAVINDCGTAMTTITGTVGASGALTAATPAYRSAKETVLGMPAGNYFVSKRIGFSAYDIHHLADSFVAANQPACYRDVHYFVKQAIDSTKFPCTGFAQKGPGHCETMKRQMMRDMYPGAKYGGYTKKEDSTFYAGRSNSVFTKKLSFPAAANFAELLELCGYSYLVRTGYRGSAYHDELPLGSVDPNWQISSDNINYFPTYAWLDEDPYGAAARVGNTISFSATGYTGEDPYHAPTRFMHDTVYYKTLINIPSDIPLDSSYCLISCDESVVSFTINGVENKPFSSPGGGDKHGMLGLQHGWNEIISKNTNVGDKLTNFYVYIVGFNPWMMGYQDTCIHLPDSVVKDGIVYKDLKNLPVQTLIEIFNDDIAEAMLPLHPEYCKLQNCNDANFESILEQTLSWQQAEANNMFMLDSLVAHDPLVLLSGGTATAARLKYIKGAGRRIDSMAMQQAYCGAGNWEELSHCAAKDYKYEIDHYIFINQTVKQNYFDNLKSLYIGNRTLIKHGKLDSTTAGCARCSTARLSKTGVPVFPSLDKAIASGSSSGDADDAALPGWMRELFRKARGKDTTGMSSVPAPLKDSMAALNGVFAEAEAGKMLERLKNCTLNPALHTRMYTAALNVLKSGRKLSPAIVQSIITDTVSLSLSDLCHPFLVAYDIMPDTRYLSTTYACAAPATYSNLLTFLQRPQVISKIRAATITVSSGVTITAANDFEKLFGTGTLTLSAYLDGVSPVCSTCYINLIVSGSLRTDTFRIVPQKYRSSADIKTALNSSTPAYSITAVRCINSDPSAMAGGAIAKNTAIVDLASGAGATPVSYYIWAANTPLMLDAPSASSLKNSLTCPDIKAALESFKAEAAAYKYSSAVNHPLYQFTITNYLNYKFGKSYLLPDYEQLMEGCAVTDKVSLDRLSAHFAVMFDTEAAEESFVTALNALGSYKPDCLRYKYGAEPIVYVDFNSIAKDTILAYKNFIDTYIGTHSSNVIEAVHNYLEHYHQLITKASCSFDPASFASDAYSEDIAVMEDGVYKTGYKMHSFRPSGTPTAKQDADLIAAVQEYLHVTTATSSASCNVSYPFFARQLLRGKDYNSGLKQQYLSYVYGLPAGSHDALITAIDPANLGASLPGFSSKTFTYDDPFCKGSRRHLYAYEPSPSACTGYNLLRNDILDAIGATLFPDKDFSYVPALGSRLAVIRKANGDYWYRYFDAASHLYNVYITPPDATLGVPCKDYSFSISGAGMGPDPYSFVASVSHGGKTVQCRGYTDFPLCSLSVVAQDVILDQV